MPIKSRVLERFIQWEQRCRGCELYPAPVELEPPFVPFATYRIQHTGCDDGRRSAFLNSLFFSATQKRPLEAEQAEEKEANWSAPQELAIFQVSPSSSPPLVAELLRLCRQKTVFEILGTEREVVTQWAVPVEHAKRWKGALESCCEGSVVSCAPSDLSNSVVVDLGLRFSAVFRLVAEPVDIAAVLDGLVGGESGLFQVIFEPLKHNWADEMLRALTLESGRPVDSDAMQSLTRKLKSGSLFAAALRLAANSPTLGRAWEIVSDIAQAISAFEGENALCPLDNAGYPTEEHLLDIRLRLTRRFGMFLGFDEMCALVAPPYRSRCRKLRQTIGRPAPTFIKAQGSLFLGKNFYANTEMDVILPADYRTRHIHLIGASGMGKTTLLFNLIRQDIESGEGLALLDPHGDLAEHVLGIIPPSRRGDVVLVDPSDEEHVIGFNILAAHSDLERNLLASDLVSIFRRLSSSWGEQMNSVLRNAILAFLESTKGGTLVEMRLFLLDPGFRKAHLSSVTDPEVIFYWERAFPQLVGNKSIGPLMTRLEAFLSRKPIRHMVSQAENRLNFEDIFEKSRILLVKLSQGLIGCENASLIGSVMVSKIHQMAMARQHLHESKRRNFWVYLDEFHHFITPSMAEILSGARKYRVGLVLAHQELQQLESECEVSSAALANCCSRIVFRVSDRDARELAVGFEHFEARDLQNLNVGEAICRIERSASDFKLNIPSPQRIDERELDLCREAARRTSNARYARRRSEVEAELLQNLRLHPSTPPSVRQGVFQKEVPPRAFSGEASSSQDAGTSQKTSPKEASSIGLGRGGNEHKRIVAAIATEASRLGFQVFKEFAVPDGRIDLFIRTVTLKVAVEVAVHSNPAHEMENLQKCAVSQADIVVLVSPNDKLRASIAQTACGVFASDIFEQMRFDSPDTMLAWLSEMATANAQSVTRRAPQQRIIAGHKVETYHLDTSSEKGR